MYGKTLSDYPEKFEGFRLALADLKPEVMDLAFQQAIKSLTEFPTPAEIRGFAEQFIGRPEFKALPKMDVKPPDWIPLDPVEVQRMVAESIEKLSTEKAMDAPGKAIHEQQRAAALEKLGGSRMPADPWESGWHEEIAVKNGWKS